MLPPLLCPGAQGYLIFDTLSRCGMVFMSSDGLDWEPLLESWIMKKEMDEEVKYGTSSTCGWNYFHRITSGWPCHWQPLPRPFCRSVQVGGSKSQLCDERAPGDPAKWLDHQLSHLLLQVHVLHTLFVLLEAILPCMQQSEDKSARYGWIIDWKMITMQLQ